ncbi:helix-turn-helix domain-containing protein [Pseudochryseolinea flava]|uniref:Transcriptional regulator n=1 Tax=Pseudochryseolinea flava TaxID=2059302 RepID=A0A364Y6R3_9BACT|nr:helix-turn-helix transcriptional regulator [Pseudochryseolinea flava]RAW02593.1 transcriptional regulator [Pseudochryseolinea flava]
MGRDRVLLLPRNQKILVTVGENIRLARLRRKFTSAIVAERANISRPTLLAIESGSTGVSIGAILQVLFVLGLEKDMLKVASDDQLGRKLQDLGLTVKKRAPKLK